MYIVDSYNFTDTLQKGYIPNKLYENQAKWAES